MPSCMGTGKRRRGPKTSSAAGRGAKGGRGRGWGAAGSKSAPAKQRGKQPAWESSDDEE